MQKKVLHSPIYFNGLFVVMVRRSLLENYAMADETCAMKYNENIHFDSNYYYDSKRRDAGAALPSFC